jgi:hypothetical protein
MREGQLQQVVDWLAGSLPSSVPTSGLPKTSFADAMSSTPVTFKVQKTSPLCV